MGERRIQTEANMKRNQALVLAALVVFVLGLAFTAVQAQEKSRHRESFDLGFLAGLDGFDTDDLKDLRKLEALKGLKIRISGLKDLEKLGERDRVRVSIDIDGLRHTLKNLGRLGERIEKDISRHMEGLHSHEFREAMRVLKNLKIDIEID
jgi:hypothetical protein